MLFLIKDARTLATKWLALAFGINMTFVAVTGLWGQDSSKASPASSTSADGAKIFAARCAVCHGADARGGEQAPPLAGNSDLKGKSIDWLRNIIHNGIPTGGMPAFNLNDGDLNAVAATVYSFNSSENNVAGDPAAGKQYFFGKGECVSCHMVNGEGAPVGPDLSNVANELTAAKIRQALLQPNARMTDGYEPVTVRLRDGRTLDGFARSRSDFETVLQDKKGQFHLLQQSEIASISQDEQSPMPPVNATPEELQNLMAYLSGLTGVKPGTAATAEPSQAGGISFSDILHPKPGEWLTYNGNLSANRYSELSGINTGNVKQLQLQWIYTVPLWKQLYPDTPYFRENLKYLGLETTPLVVDGIMYATGPQQAYALDARTGQQIWSYTRTRTPGLLGDASLGTNRGMAVLGDKVFMTTDNAHLIALNRITGRLVWEVVMPENPMHFGSTVAPLAIKGMVIAGVSGGSWGMRGFVAAYNPSDGKLVWRRWTVPDKGDPEAKTWGGDPPEIGGGAATWTTGSYDPETDTLYWSTGNPYPDADGKDRPGDYLYANCVLAMEPDTGKLKWFYQETPHDLRDKDATAAMVLVDAVQQGQQRKLLLQAGKNGFFYVLDRTNGHVLVAQPFVKRVTWASGIGPDDRPQLLTEHGITCPWQAADWNSTAFDPTTHLYYIMALEKCRTITSGKKELHPKENVTMSPEEDSGQKYLEALDINDGKIVWKLPLRGPALGKRNAGILITAGGLLIYSDPSGNIVIADPRDGKPLWHFPTNGETKSSPITYTVDGKQYFALAVGPNILAFALP
jgi:PQQ-dependent dehydrogenase (methanol/ethanol family)